MHRHHTHTISVILLVVIFYVLPFGSAVAQRISPREVTERITVYHVDGKNDGVNLVVIEGRFSLALINTAWHPLATQIIRNMITDSFDNLPLKYVANLSAEPRNSAGNQVFPNAIIVAHENTSAHLRVQTGLREEKLAALRVELAQLDENSEGARKSELEKEIAEAEFARIVVPTRTSSVDFEIPLPGAAVQLRHFPGAVTDGDFIALVPSERALITGDIVRNEAVPHWNPALGGSFRGLLQAVESLFALERQYRHVIPGRGPVGGFEIVRAQHSYLLGLLQRVTTARAEGLTLEEAKEQLGIGVYSTWVDYEELFPLQVEQLWNELEAQRPMSTPER